MIPRRTNSAIVYICSPYSGDKERNTEYAKQLVKDAIARGLTPIAPHLYLPIILDDNNPEERQLGLKCGLDLLPVCRCVIVGDKYGISEGMAREIAEANRLGIPTLRA